MGKKTMPKATLSGHGMPSLAKGESTLVTVDQVSAMLGMAINIVE